VPTYDYRCERTGEMFELWQSFSDDALTECPQTHKGEKSACGAPVRKVFSKVGIAFKGDGFYKNDHGSSSRPKSESASGDSGSTTSPAKETASKDSGKDSGKGSSQDSGKGSSQDSGKGSSQDSSKGSSKDSPKSKDSSSGSKTSSSD
jgi:putative FmdB family regulatory protein